MDYLRLRKVSGLSARTREEAENGITGAWASVCAIHVESEETRKGIVDAILTALLNRVDEVSPNAYVNLPADPPGRRLYERHGFIEGAPASVGIKRA